MPRNPDLRTPASYVPPGDWPDGELSTPGLAEYARQIVLNLRAAIGPRSVREVARLASLTPTTLAGLLNGDRWPDTLTLAKLEDALDAQLWPTRTEDLRRETGAR